MSTIGLISPGAMGVSVGAAARVNQHDVLFAGDRRSEVTKSRAAAAGLIDCKTISNMIQRADIILSVCPPHDARKVARQISSTDFQGLFVDANAIAPAVSREIAAMFADNQYVDGGIIGGPAWDKSFGTTLYLSGPHTGEVCTLFDDSPLLTRIVSDDIGAASALKMVFAAYTKGTTALLAAILGVAEQEGVRTHLEQQWGAGFTNETHKRLTNNSAKAWRFAGEMQEIAATFAAAGFPAGFHQSASAVFERLEGFKDSPAASIDDLLEALTEQSPRDVSQA